MDLNDIWQEHKRFIVALAAGLTLFLVGTIAVDRFFGSELRAARRRLTTSERSLKEERYDADALGQAREENEALRVAIKELEEVAAFKPRPAFELASTAAGVGSASGQYFALVDSVRDELVTMASRSRVRVPDDLGLEMLQTTRGEVIERHLEALDLIDRVTRMSIELGVDRIDGIQVRLDPAFDSRKGVGAVERTRVTFKMTSQAQPVAELIARSQTPQAMGGEGAALPIETVDVIGARSKTDEVRAELTFLVVRLHTQDEDVQEEI